MNQWFRNVQAIDILISYLDLYHTEITGNELEKLSVLQFQNYQSLKKHFNSKGTNKERIQINAQKDNKINICAHCLTSETWNRLCVWKKEEGRGLARIEDCVDASMKGVEDYIKKRQKN